MKKSLIFIAGVAVLVFILNRDYLPYELELSKVDLTYTIDCKSDGIPVIQENSHLAMQEYSSLFDRATDTLEFNRTHPIVKFIKKYTTNKLGLVVYVETTNGDFKYVAINPEPKEKQVYGERLFNYKIYTEEEYKKLGINDWWWHKLSFR